MMSISALPLVKEQAPLVRASAGDGEAFAQIVRLHQAMVFSIAWHVLRDRTVAEDLAQEVFLQLYRNLDEIESEEHLVFWLRKVASHRCIDALRRRTILPVPLEEAGELGAEDGARDLLLERRIRNAVATLPPQQRVALTLRYQEDLDPREIAGIMEQPLNTVKSHLRRALATLRSELGDGEGAET
jgi:RNA polymerase sigma-70 factor (ECF subfamily)